MTLTLTKTLPKTLTAQQAADVRRAWERDTTALADEVQAWAEQEGAGRGWRVEREEKELSEEKAGGAYRVPVVTIHAPHGDLVLEPIARAVPAVMGAQGRVDLYAYPSFFRVMLMHRSSGGGGPLEWVARTESGLDWPQPWGRETFLTLADGLLKA